MDRRLQTLARPPSRGSSNKSPVTNSEVSMGTKATPPINKALLRDYTLNKALFIGGVALGGGILGSHEVFHTSLFTHPTAILCWNFRMSWFCCLFNIFLDLSRQNCHGFAVFSTFFWIFLDKTAMVLLSFQHFFGSF